MAWWNTMDAPHAQGGAPSIDSQPQSGGFDWGTVLNVGGNILGNVLPAIISNEGANKAADAATAGNQASIDLQRRIYEDQVSRSEPWRKSGFNALNFLNQWNGLPQVTDTGGAISAGAYDPNAPSASNNWGAGRPVAGHTGGGGPNALTGALGAGVGNFFGGPIGGAVGGVLGGIVRNGGDNWKTLATGAPAGLAYDEYFNSQPGFATEWAKPDVQALFNGDRNAYIWWHANGGNIDGKQSWAPNADWLSRNTPTPAGTTPGAGTGTSSTTPASTTPDLWGTIKANPLYVAATQGFLGIDKPQVEGAYSTAGQALSGAKEKALFDRGTARSYNALRDIYGGYSELAGVGSRTASEQNSNAGQYGVNAGNMLAQNGTIAGQAAATKNANWLKAGAGAVGGIYDYGKSQGWFGG